MAPAGMVMYLTAEAWIRGSFREFPLAVFAALCVAGCCLGGWVLAAASDNERPRALCAVLVSWVAIAWFLGSQWTGYGWVAYVFTAGAICLLLLSAAALEFPWKWSVLTGLLLLVAYVFSELMRPHRAHGIAAVVLTVGLLRLVRRKPQPAGLLWLGLLPLAVAVFEGASWQRPMLHQWHHDPLTEINENEWYRMELFARGFGITALLLVAGMIPSLVTRTSRLRLGVWRGWMPAPALVGALSLISMGGDAFARTLASEARWLQIPVDAPIIDAPIDSPWGYWGPTIYVTTEAIYVHDRVSEPRAVASPRQAAESAALAFKRLEREQMSPDFVEIVTDAETPMSRVLDLLPHLENSDVPEVALTYLAPLPGPRAPTLRDLQPRPRHVRFALADSGVSECEQQVLDIMELEVGRVTSNMPWSRILIVGSTLARLPLAVPPKLSYGDFMRRLVTGLSLDPPRVQLELVDARHRRHCKP